MVSVTSKLTPLATHGILRISGMAFPEMHSQEFRSCSGYRLLSQPLQAQVGLQRPEATVQLTLASKKPSWLFCHGRSLESVHLRSGDQLRLLKPTLTVGSQPHWQKSCCPWRRIHSSTRTQHLATVQDESQREHGFSSTSKVLESPSFWWTLKRCIENTATVLGQKRGVTVAATAVDWRWVGCSRDERIDSKRPSSRETLCVSSR